MVAVARSVADAVAAAERAGERPLVVGEDCTIELGTIAGLLRRDDDLALLYVDGGVDLRAPADNPTGILDSMGVAHLSGAPGTDGPLARLGPRYPLLADERIVLFGFEPLPGGPEEAALGRYRMPRYPASGVRDDPARVAADALAVVERLAPRFALYFDVDVVDFTDCPLADVPQHNAGLTLDEAIACLRVLATSPRLAALTITELNPDHADEAGLSVKRLAAGLASALAGMV